MKFTIEGRLDNLNTYTKACRSNKYMGANLKKKNEMLVKVGIMEAHLKPVEHYPVRLKIKWYEKDGRRDIDNIVFATKFIQDALVNLRILKDDSQKYVRGLSHEVYVDADYPRIEVEIEEIWNVFE